MADEEGVDAVPENEQEAVESQEQEGRPDLFGASDSEDDEAEVPTEEAAEEADGEQGDDALEEGEAEEAGEARGEEEGEGDAQPEADAEAAEGEGGEGQYAEGEGGEEEDGDAGASQGQDGEQQQGAAHDDIFASDSDDEAGGRGGNASEAEDEDEVDEFEAMFQPGKKRKRKEGRTQEMVEIVETLVANMEVAAEMDISANEAGKPAVNKLKMLGSVEDTLSQAYLHRELLDGGILGAMKLWVELLPDGSLPNAKVRTSVLKLLHRLPIDLNQEGRKEQLKKSQLGKYVMFYSKLPEESLGNRQLARSLVEKWSRPIFDQYREREKDEEMQEREAELARMRKEKRQRREQAAPSQASNKNLQPGDPGFRWHASIPAPARLDYLHQPESKVQQGEGEAVRGKAKPKDRMSKKLAAMARKGAKAKRGPSEGRVSMQGRGLAM